MKLPGTYIDHPSLGWIRVPDTIVLNGYEYEYHPDLGFIKKLVKKVKKVSDKIGLVKPIKKVVGGVGKPIEKALKPLVPKQIRKLVPKELKGGIEKPIGAAAAIYFTGGAALPYLKTAGGALAAGAAKVGAGALAAGKALAPAAGGLLMSAAKGAGQVGTAALEQAPQLLALQQQIQQQRAQAEIAEIETQASLQAMQAQREYEQAIRQYQLETMYDPARAITSPPAAYFPTGGGGGAPVNVSMPGQSAPGAGGMNQGTMIALGAGALVLALMVSRK